MEPEVKDKPTEPRRVWPIIASVVGFIILIIISIFLINRHTRSLVSGLVSDPSLSLRSEDGRTNLVLLGLGGKGHEAPDLTDSIMLVSLRHSDSNISLISLPRDIWIDTMKAKINTAYHYGNAKREGGGLDLAKSAVGETLGIPVHYAVALDFDGFVKAIDAVGGIEVDVKNAFDDYEYPIPGKENAEPESDRYEHLHFDAGPTQMDGTTALKFARSRHAEGDEGTDFARGARQQQVLLAFKNKILQSQTFLNQETMRSVITSLQSSIDTDIQESEYGSFLRFFLSFQSHGEVINSISIEDLLLNPKNTSPYQGQWVLVPARDWQEIYDFVSDSLK